MKTIKRTDSKRRAPGQHGFCTITDCKEETSGNKPYCIKHLNNLPYVKQLENELVARENEIKIATRRHGWKKIKSNSNVSKDIIELVKEKGVMTPAGISKISDIKLPVIHEYLKKLSKINVLKVFRLGSRRGTWRRIVTLH